MSDPPFWNSAVLAAALSAFLVSLANLYLDDRRNKKDIYQRQQQAYSELTGRNDIIADTIDAVLVFKESLMRIRMDYQKVKVLDAECKKCDMLSSPDSEN
jgi:hypothetical protein